MTNTPLSSWFTRSNGNDEIAAILHQRLIHTFDDSEIRDLDRESVRRMVDRAARAILAEEYPQVVGDDKEDIISDVVNDVTGMGPIEPLLRDPKISEVMVNAPDEVYYERDGVIYESDVRFRSTEHVMRVIERIVTALGRHVDEASPMVDARLADGSRVNVIIPPLVSRSPVLTIRKFRTDMHSMRELLQVGTLSEDMATFLKGCVQGKVNIVVSGGTGTGKTTFLNALSEYLPEKERIITIEDPLELRLNQKHVVAMEARPPSAEGRGEVTQRSLLRNALRMRPDRIIVGEVRGSEAFDMMQAMNTGHEGSLTSVHANSPRDALARMENMIMMSGFELPVTAIREQMSSALHLLIHLVRMVDGSRKIVQVSEISGMEGQTVTMQDIFVFQHESFDAEGRVVGSFKPTGLRPQFTDRLKAFGVTFPDTMFGLGRWA